VKAYQVLARLCVLSLLLEAILATTIVLMGVVIGVNNALQVGQITGDLIYAGFVGGATFVFTDVLPYMTVAAAVALLSAGLTYLFYFIDPPS
jgi:hypothetical protein